MGGEEVWLAVKDDVQGMLPMYAKDVGQPTACGNDDLGFARF